MPIRLFKFTLYIIFLPAVLSCLGGCSALDQYTSVPPLQLNEAEEARVGAAVEKKLLQMLGGSYQDISLAEDVSRLVQDRHPFRISIADRSSAAFYPLPGHRAIVTRGLLSEINSLSELVSLLKHATRLSGGLYDGRVTRGMARATDEFLSASDPEDGIDSPATRLARLFEKRLCANTCLEVAGTVTGKAGLMSLPNSIKRLSSLQAGYALADSARRAEQSNNPAQAIALYLQAATMAPGEPRILASLGLAYLRSGEMSQARIHLQNAVKSQPDYYRTQMGLGYIYLQQGELREADRVLTRSVELFPIPENLFLLAETKEKKGDLEGAVLMYRQVMASDRISKLGRSAADRLIQLKGSK